MNLAPHDHSSTLEALRAAMQFEIDRRDVEIDQRDEIITKHLALIAHRDVEIAHRTSEIAKRDEIIVKRDEIINERNALLANRDRLIEQLRAANAKLRHHQFGAKSERFDPTQQALFDASIDEDMAANESAIEVLESTAPTTPRAPRQTPKRQPLPAHLPRVIEHIEAASCTCIDCGGALHQIGEEVSEKLDVKPAEFFVRRTIRPKLACRACENIQTPPALPSIIERGIPAPGLLAQVMVNKYADHLPLYRQREMILRSGVDLPLSTLSSWVGATGFALDLLVALLRQELRRDKILHADETPVQQLAPGRGKTKTSYLFAYRRGEIEEPPIIVFDYAQTRSGQHARSFLQGFGGALVVDDYVGYKSLIAQNGLREIACWAHARRKFFDLHQANKSTIAEEALTRIGELYAIEKIAREQKLDAPARHQLRQTQARPKIEDLYQWLTQTRAKTNNNSGTAKAIDYLLKRKQAFTAYLDDGCFPIDNNPVENAIRPIALGRKNWLFTGSLEAGLRAANIMSLIQSAKANGHNPIAYLTDILTRLPTQPADRMHELLPHHWQPKNP